jgi:glycosyltransferase involved in cell wall biosynthesis
LNPDKSAAQLALQRQAYRFAHAIVANSTAAAQRLEREGVPAARVRVIANGIALDRFAQPARARRGIRTIVTVANLRREKAHEVLIAALATLAPRHPELTLQIVGDGPRRQELEGLVSAHGLDRQVRFLGHREDVASLLAAADLFVLPSRSEAFPNGAMEAMAAGLPVVACAVGGLLDLIEDGRTGALVFPDSVPDMASAIESFVLSPERAAAIGEAAREEIAGRYSFDRMVGAFEELYVAQLERAGARALAAPSAEPRRGAA